MSWPPGIRQTPLAWSLHCPRPTLDTSITLMENRARGVEDPPAWPAGDMEKAAEDTECWTSILLHSRCHSPLLQKSLLHGRQTPPGSLQLTQNLPLALDTDLPTHQGPGFKH
ncbi:sentrin-specific protease 8 isoform 2-T4 [Megaptera novaeangliae]